ncbi:MAG: hypothetical protein ACI9KN_002172 [Gammaproteobacteria bacterium]|jgi:hypothetical protein
MINKACLFVLLLAVSMSSSANSLRIFTLGADDWAQPRSGTVITQFDAVRSAIDYWGKGVDSAILIRYPGEDSGEIWATELRDWLISLGIPSDYILLMPGSQVADEIKLIVGRRDELK